MEQIIEEPERQFPQPFVRLIESIHAPEPEGQFDYQEASRAAIEQQREERFTHSLKELGCWIDSAELERIDPDEGDFPVEATVVIPVKNRVATIVDAVRSACAQQTSFAYNIIVVDNLSTDGTPQAVAALAANDPRIILLQPEDETLSIGGCWNEAIESEQCGRWAVQLDSDDLYAGPDTLQRIVDTMRSERAAMLAGAYSLVDMNLQPIPPGVIAHNEWTEHNGHNNLLRVNGVGAPRAYFTPVARRFRFWDVGYGEDYAMALDITGKYRLARIFDPIYLCRRWEGNSDARETPELHAARQRWKDERRLEALEVRALRNLRRGTFPALNLWLIRLLQQAQEGVGPQWDEATRAAETARSKWIEALDAVWQVVLLQHRAVSTHANLSAEAVAARPCFLCEDNRPERQLRVRLKMKAGMYDFLLNPRPVVPGQITVASVAHKPQEMNKLRLVDMTYLAHRLAPLTVFFNSPGAGASAPDHFHFQLVERDFLPGLFDGPGALRFSSNNPEEWVKKTLELIDSLEGKPYNLFCTYVPESASLHLALWPRRAHRPANYPVTGISPGSLEMAGLVVTTTREHFNAVNAETLAAAMRDTMLLADD